MMEMAMGGNTEDRLLSIAERTMAGQPGIAQLSTEELQALGKRLREARDRALRIGHQQHREMRGKAEPPEAPCPLATMQGRRRRRRRWFMH
jgi:hypothetical protein